MTTPIGNQSSLAVQSVQETGGSPTPLGTGAAPTTMQPAVESQPSEQKGYVERFVLWIRDWIVWIFSKIFWCFGKKEREAESSRSSLAPGPESQGVQELSAASTEQPLLATTQQLEVNEAVRADMELLNAFDCLPKEAQNLIYQRIGRNNRGWSLLNYVWRPDEDIGRRAVRQNPQLLSTYLVNSTNRPLVTQENLSQ